MEIYNNLKIKLLRVTQNIIKHMKCDCNGYLSIYQEHTVVTDIFIYNYIHRFFQSYPKTLVGCLVLFHNGLVFPLGMIIVLLLGNK